MMLQSSLHQAAALHPSSRKSTLSNPLVQVKLNHRMKPPTLVVCELEAQPWCQHRHLSSQRKPATRSSLRRWTSQERPHHLKCFTPCATRLSVMVFGFINSGQLGLRSLLPCHEQEQLYQDSSEQFTFKAQHKLLFFSFLL